MQVLEKTNSYLLPQQKLNLADLSWCLSPISVRVWCKAHCPDFSQRGTKVSTAYFAFGVNGRVRET
jgi:hypothetical protein